MFHGTSLTSDPDQTGGWDKGRVLGVAAALAGAFALAFSGVSLTAVPASAHDAVRLGGSGVPGSVSSRAGAASDAESGPSAAASASVTTPGGGTSVSSTGTQASAGAGASVAQEGQAALTASEASSSDAAGIPVGAGGPDTAASAALQAVGATPRRTRDASGFTAGPLSIEDSGWLVLGPDDVTTAVTITVDDAGAYHISGLQAGDIKDRWEDATRSVEYMGVEFQGLSGPYQITVNGSGVRTAAPLGLRLDNDDIESPAPLSLLNGAQVNVQLLGVNTLEATSSPGQTTRNTGKGSAINVPQGTALTLTSAQATEIAPAGSLTAIADDVVATPANVNQQGWAAGIGGPAGQAAGDVTIGGAATVTAEGATGGAGIGGSYGKAVSSIQVTDSANVTATARLSRLANYLHISGAGIGGGYSAAGGAITISGNPVVRATGGQAGAGIGAHGAATDAPGATTVDIQGGTVLAQGGGPAVNTSATVPAAAGIGGGSSTTPGNVSWVQISGGFVAAASGAAGVDDIGHVSPPSQHAAVAISGGSVWAEHNRIDKDADATNRPSPTGPLDKPTGTLPVYPVYLPLSVPLASGVVTVPGKDVTLNPGLVTAVTGPAIGADAATRRMVRDFFGVPSAYPIDTVAGVLWAPADTTDMTPATVGSATGLGVYLEPDLTDDWTTAQSNWLGVPTRLTAVAATGTGTSEAVQLTFNDQLSAGPALTAVRLTAGTGAAAVGNVPATAVAGSGGKAWAIGLDHNVKSGNVTLKLVGGGIALSNWKDTGWSVTVTNSGAPQLYPGEVTRFWQQLATVRFGSNLAGTYRYLVAPAAAQPPSQAEVLASSLTGSVTAGRLNVIHVAALADAGAYTAYIVATASTQNSAVLAVPIPAFDPNAVQTMRLTSADLGPLMTITIVDNDTFRIQGLINGHNAARDAYENDTFPLKTVKILWDQVTGSHQLLMTPGSFPGALPVSIEVKDCNLQVTTNTYNGGLLWDVFGRMDLDVSGTNYFWEGSGAGGWSLVDRPGSLIHVTSADNGEIQLMSLGYGFGNGGNVTLEGNVNVLARGSTRGYGSAAGTLTLRDSASLDTRQNANATALYAGTLNVQDDATVTTKAGNGHAGMEVTNLNVSGGTVVSRGRTTSTNQTGLSATNATLTGGLVVAVGWLPNSTTVGMSATNVTIDGGSLYMPSGILNSTNPPVNRAGQKVYPVYVPASLPTPGTALDLTGSKHVTAPTDWAGFTTVSPNPNAQAFIAGVFPTTRLAAVPWEPVTATTGTVTGFQTQDASGNDVGLTVNTAVPGNYATNSYAASLTNWLGLPVNLSSAVADGAAGATTSSHLTLTFAGDVSAPIAASVRITAGTGSATVGTSVTAASGNPGNAYDVALQPAITEGDVTVAVAGGGIVSQTPAVATVHKSPNLTLVPGAVSLRVAADAETVKFSSDQAGTYVYALTAAGQTAPPSFTGLTAHALAANTNVLSLTEKDLGVHDSAAKKLWIQGTAGGSTAVTSLDIPAAADNDGSFLKLGPSDIGGQVSIVVDDADTYHVSGITNPALQAAALNRSIASQGVWFDGITGNVSIYVEGQNITGTLPVWLRYTNMNTTTFDPLQLRDKAWVSLDIEQTNQLHMMLYQEDQGAAISVLPDTRLTLTSAHQGKLTITPSSVLYGSVSTGAGIGGPRDKSSGVATIEGNVIADITAGASPAAAIGGAYNGGSQGTVIRSDAEVTAYAPGGAGIGGGNGMGGVITIGGRSQVYARGGAYAGIGEGSGTGCGESIAGGCQQRITIEDQATVVAVSNAANFAGIGGTNVTPATVDITGGFVVASSGGTQADIGGISGVPTGRTPVSITGGSVYLAHGLYQAVTAGTTSGAQNAYPLYVPTAVPNQTDGTQDQSLAGGQAVTVAGTKVGTTASQDQLDFVKSVFPAYPSDRLAAEVWSPAGLGQPVIATDQVTGLTANFSHLASAATNTYDKVSTDWVGRANDVTVTPEPAQTAQTTTTLRLTFTEAVPDLEAKDLTLTPATVTGTDVAGAAAGLGTPVKANASGTQWTVPVEPPVTAGLVDLRVAASAHGYVLADGETRTVTLSNAQTLTLTPGTPVRVTDTDAWIRFTADRATTEEYKYLIQQSGGAAPDCTDPLVVWGTGTPIAAGLNQFAIPGLAQGTAYDVYVCGTAAGSTTGYAEIGPMTVPATPQPASEVVLTDQNTANGTVTAQAVTSGIYLLSGVAETADPTGPKNGQPYSIGKNPIRLQGVTGPDRLILDGGAQQTADTAPYTLTLDHVAMSGGPSPLVLQNGAYATVKVDGANQLTATNKTSDGRSAALQVDPAASLTLTDDGASGTDPDQLTADASAGYGSGIGGSWTGVAATGSAGAIHITGSVHVTALSGQDEAGIGGGSTGSGSQITIDGTAEVHASAGQSQNQGEHSAGIGGGTRGTGGTIVIGGSAHVTAIGGRGTAPYTAATGGGPGIGAQSNNGTFSGPAQSITIQDQAVVVAKGGNGAPGIGAAGGTLAGATLTITGGFTTAASPSGATADIGGFTAPTVPTGSNAFVIQGGSLYLEHNLTAIQPYGSATGTTYPMQPVYLPPAWNGSPLAGRAITLGGGNDKLTPPTGTAKTYADGGSLFPFGQLSAIGWAATTDSLNVSGLPGSPASATVAVKANPGPYTTATTNWLGTPLRTTAPSGGLSFQTDFTLVHPGKDPATAPATQCPSGMTACDTRPGTIDGQEGWANYSQSTVVHQADGVQALVPAGSWNDRTTWTLRPTGAASATQFISATLAPASAQPRQPYLLAHVGGGASAYAFGLYSLATGGGVQVRAVVGGVPTNLGAVNLTDPYDRTHTYQLELLATPLTTGITRLTGRVVDLTTGVMEAELTVTDQTAALQAAGTAGVMSYDAGPGSVRPRITAFTYRTDQPAATTYTVIGPTTAKAGVDSDAFTVMPDGWFTGTITPSDGGLGGLFTPKSLTFDGAWSPQSFTYAPATGGHVDITFSSGGALVDPAPHGIDVTYPPAGTGFTIEAPKHTVDAGVPDTFTVRPNGTFQGTIKLTSSDGTIEPATVTFELRDAVKTFTYTAAHAGSNQITGEVTNGTLTNPNAQLTFDADVKGSGSFTITGPGTIQPGVSYQYTLSPVRTITSTITLTDTPADGTFNPPTLTFTASGAPQTFTYTPRNVGDRTISGTPNTALGSSQLPVQVRLGGATTFVIAGPSMATVGQATSFIVTPNGPFIGTITVGVTGGGTFSNPAADQGMAVVDGQAQLTFKQGDLSHTFGYTPDTPGVKTFDGSAPEDGSQVAMKVTRSLTAPATGFGMTPPHWVLKGRANAFTLTPNGPYTGSVVITDSAGGTFGPAGSQATSWTLSYTASSATQNFQFAPADGVRNGTLTAHATDCGEYCPAADSTLAYSVFQGELSALQIAGDPGELFTGQTAVYTVTPNGPYAGSVHISDYTAAGKPASGTFSKADPADTGIKLDPYGSGVTLTFTDDLAEMRFAYTPDQPGDIVFAGAADDYGGKAIDVTQYPLTVPADAFTIDPPATVIRTHNQTYQLTANGAISVSATLGLTEGSGLYTSSTTASFSGTSRTTTFQFQPDQRGATTLTATAVINGHTVTGQVSFNVIDVPATGVTVGSVTEEAASAPGVADAGATVTWSLPSGFDDGGSPVTGFLVRTASNDPTVAAPPPLSVDGATATSARLTGLVAGVTYTVTVFAVNAAGTSTTAGTTGATTPYTVPGQPAAPSLTAGDHQIGVAWVAPDETGGRPITGYRVQWRSAGSNDAWQTRDMTGAGATSTTLSQLDLAQALGDSSLDPVEKNFEVQVRAQSVAGDGPASASAVSSPYGAPGAPSGVTALADAGGGVLVSWTLGDARGSALTGFRAQYNSGSGWTTVGQSEFIPVATSATASTVRVLAGEPRLGTNNPGGPLIPGTQYSFRVAQINAAGVGAYSTDAALAAPFTVPAAVTDAAATGGPDGSIAVTWSAPDDGGAAISSYTVSYSTDKSTWTALAGTVTGLGTTIPASKLTIGSTYFVKVVAANARGTGPAPAATDLPSATSLKVPAAPGSLAVQKDASAPVLVASWSEVMGAAAGGKAVTTYRLRYHKSSSTSDAGWVTEDVAAATCSAGTCSDTVSNIVPATAYDFQVAAVNEVGQGSWSGVVTGKTDAFPKLPYLTDVTAGAGSVTLSWEPNSDQADITPANYWIEYRAQSKDAWPDPTSCQAGSCVQIAATQARTTTVSGLTPGQVYDFRVFSLNSQNGMSQPSGVRYATPYQKPGQPLNLQAATGKPGELVATWQAPASDGYTPLTGYTLQYATVNASGDQPGDWAAGTEVSVTDGKALTHTLTGLAAGAVYAVRLAAVNAAGAGQWSGTAWLAVIGQAGPVQNLAVQMKAPTTDPAKGSAVLTWAPPASNGGAPILRYQVSWYTSGDEQDAQRDQVAAGGTLTDTISGLTLNGDWVFIVAAETSAGLGQAATIIGRTFAAPGAVDVTAAVPQPDGTVAVAWGDPASDNSSAITSFTVRWRTVASGASGVWQSQTVSGSTARAAVVSGLTPETAYVFGVVANNAAGAGSTDGATAQATPYQKPGAPASGQVTAGLGQLTVTWTAPADDGASPVTGYTVGWRLAQTSDAWQSRTVAATVTTLVLTTADLVQALPAGATDPGGRNFAIQVQASNLAGAGPALAIGPGMPYTVPGAPTGLTAQAAATGGVTLSWTAPQLTNGSAIQGYKVQYGTGGTWTDWRSVTGTTATVSADEPRVDPNPDGPLQIGTAYSFRVQAVNAAGGGAWSTENAVATPYTVPAPITLMTADGVAPGDGTIDVTWAAPDNGGSPIDQYRIEWATDPAQTTWSGETVQVSDLEGTNWNLASALLNKGTVYYVRVLSHNQRGWSPAPGASDLAHTTLTALPAAPTGLTLTKATDTPAMDAAFAQVTGSAAGGQPVTSYALRYRPTGSPTTTLWATQYVDAPTAAGAVQVRVVNITPGVGYDYEVAAINAAGRGPWSPAVAGATDPYPQLPAITGLTAGDGSMTVTWAPNTDTTLITPDRYWVQYRVQSGAVWTAPTSCQDATCVVVSHTAELTHTFEGLTPGTTYEVRVYSLSAVGLMSDPSGTHNTTPYRKSDPPTGVAGEVTGAGAVKVTWIAPVSTGYTDLTGYQVKYAPVSGTGIAPGSWTGSGAGSVTAAAADKSAALTGLTPGQWYALTVVAQNAAGDSNAAATAWVHVFAPAAAPGDLTATANAPSPTDLAHGSVTLAWNVPSDNGGSAIDYYEVSYQAGSGTATTFQVGASTLTTTVTSLAVKTEVTFTVKAHTVVGLGAAATAKATPFTVPGASPSGVTAQPGHESATIGWTPVTATDLNATGGSPITGYRVYYWAIAAPDDVQHQDVDGKSAAGVTLAGLTGGQSYNIQVRSLNAAGESGTFNNGAGTVGVLPYTEPGAPTGLSATARAGGQVQLSWVAPGDGGSAIQGYDVLVKAAGATDWDPTRTVRVTGTVATVTFGADDLGTQFAFAVRALNASPNPGQASSVATATPIDVPAAPGIEAASDGSGGIAVTWTVPASHGSAITGWQVHYADADDPTDDSVMDVAGGGTTAANIGGLDAGTAYSVWVVAINAAGTGPASGAVRVTAGIPAGSLTMTGLTAGNAGELAATWTWGGKTGAGVGFKLLYRLATATGDWSTAAGYPVPISTRSQVIAAANLTVGLAYDAEVCLTDKGGALVDGACSAPLRATPHRVPDAPTGLAATATTAGAVNLTWNAPASNGGAAVTEYALRYQPATSDPDTGLWTVIRTGSTALQATVPAAALQTGHAYRFQVLAQNVAGDSAWSSAEQATPFGVPDAPTGVTATALATGGVQVSWTAPAWVNGSAITGYAVEYGTGGTWTAVPNAAADASSVTIPANEPKVTPNPDGPLQPGTAYSFHVAALNAAGRGAWSSEQAAATPYTVPDAVTPVSADGLAGQDGSIQVTWTAPASGGDPVTAYWLEFAAAGTTAWATVSETIPATTLAWTIPATRLALGTTYQVRVRAENRRGWSPLATGAGIGSAIATAVPAAPGDLALTLAADAPAMDIAFSQVTGDDAGGQAVTGYQLRYRPTGDSDETHWVVRDLAVPAGAGQVTARVTGLDAGRSYDYQVAAQNPAGQGPWSTVQAKATEAAPQLPAITSLEPGAGSATVQWKANADGTLVAPTTYWVQYRVESDAEWATPTSCTAATCAVIAASGTLSKTFTGLTAGTVYDFRVYSLNSQGLMSQASGVRYTTPYEVSDAPTGVTATMSGPGTVQVAWTAPAHTGYTALTGYKIRYVAVSATGIVPDWTASGVEGQNTDADQRATELRALEPGHWYAVTVLANNPAGLSEPATPAWVNVFAAASAPRGLSATPNPPSSTDVTNGSVTVSWQEPASDGGTTIDYYTVDWAAASGGGAGTVQVAATGPLSTTITGLAVKVEHTFRVSAHTIAGDGAQATATATPFTVPGSSPADVTATALFEAARIDWTPVTGSGLDETGGSPITGYQVTYWPSGSPDDADTVTVSGGTAATTTLTPLVGATTYQVQVRSMNAAGVSPNFNGGAATVTVLPYTVPGAPGGLTATALAGGVVKLTWTEPAANGSAVTGYDVLVRAASESSWDPARGTSVTDPAATLTFAPADLGTEFEVAVRAHNASEDPGPESDAVTVVPIDVPDAPTIAAAQDGAGGIAVTWNAPNDHGGPISSWTIHYRDQAVGGDWSELGVLGGATRQGTLRGLDVGSCYEIWVTATNHAGTGPASNHVTATNGIAPGSLVLTTLTPGGDGSATAQWTWSGNTGPRVAFMLRYRPVGSTVEWGRAPSYAAAVTARSATIKADRNDFKAGVTYEVVVCFSDRYGAMVPNACSEAKQVTPRVVPDVPTNLKATPDSTGDVVLTWTTPGWDGGSAITGYEMRYQLTSADQNTGIWMGLGTGSTDTTGTVPARLLQVGVPYRFQVAAVNVAGVSAWTQSQVATPVKLAAAPLGVSVQQLPGFVSLTWAGVGSDGGSAVTGFQVLVGTDQDGPWTDSGLVLDAGARGATLGHDDGLTLGTAYWFTVRAVTAVGPGNMAVPVRATPQQLGAAPDQVTAAVTEPSQEATDAGLTVTWTPVSSGDSTPRVGAVLEYHTTGQTVSGAMRATGATGANGANGANGATGAKTGAKVGATVGAKVGAGVSAGADQVPTDWSRAPIGADGYVSNTGTTFIPFTEKLPRGLTYEVRVTLLASPLGEDEADNALWQWGVSNPVGVTQSTPGRPTDLTATGLPGGIALTWVPPRDTGGIDQHITEYEVWAQGGSWNDWTLVRHVAAPVADSDDLAPTITPAQPTTGTTGTSGSEPSPQTGVAPARLIVPAADDDSTSSTPGDGTDPTTPTVGDDSTSATPTTSPTDGPFCLPADGTASGTATNTIAPVTPGSGDSSTTPTPNLPACPATTFDRLKSGTVYEFYVVAVNELGPGVPSDQVGATTLATPPRILPPQIPALKLTLTPAVAPGPLMVGGPQLKLSVAVEPSNQTDGFPVWASSAASVAKVVNGVVTPVAPGKATITVFMSARTAVRATMEITVQPRVSKIATTLKTLRVVRGKSVRVGVMVYGSDVGKGGKVVKRPGTAVKGQVTLQLSASNKKVAQAVRAGASNGRLTANLGKVVVFKIKTGRHRAGTSVVRLTAANGQKLSIKVKVVKKATKLKGAVVRGKSSVRRGKAIMLRAKLRPGKATGVRAIWRVTPGRRATIDAAGRLVAKARGTVTVKLKVGKVKVRKVIRVR